MVFIDIVRTDSNADFTASPVRKIWVLIQRAPAQLQSVARTLKTETHSLHSAIRPLAVKPIVYVCVHVCPRLLFVVQRRSVCQFLLFRAPRGSAAPEADWCRSRRLYVNSRRMLADTQKRVVVQHFLLFVSHSPLRWSSFGTIRVHHFPINRLNDFWVAPRLMLHDHICTTALFQKWWILAIFNKKYCANLELAFQNCLSCSDHCPHVAAPLPEAHVASLPPKKWLNPCNASLCVGRNFHWHIAVSSTKESTCVVTLSLFLKWISWTHFVHLRWYYKVDKIDCSLSFALHSLYCPKAERKHLCYKYFGQTLHCLKGSDLF